MTAFLIADITVHDPERYKDYVRQVPDIIARHGGRYRVRGGNPDVREGSWLPERLVVIEFPSREKALDFLNDPDYRPVAAIRHAAASTSLIVTDGVESIP